MKTQPEPRLIMFYRCHWIILNKWPYERIEDFRHWNKQAYVKKTTLNSFHRNRSAHLSLTTGPIWFSSFLFPSPSSSLPIPPLSPPPRSHHSPFFTRTRHLWRVRGSFGVGAGVPFHRVDDRKRARAAPFHSDAGIERRPSLLPRPTSGLQSNLPLLRRTRSLPKISRALWVTLGWF